MFFMRSMRAMNGNSVEDILTYLYNDQEKFIECGGYATICVILNNVIVMGDGCTTCGRKVIDLAMELGLTRP